MGLEPFVGLAHQMIRCACYSLESEVYHRVDLLWDKVCSEMSRDQFEAALSELAERKVIEFHGGDTSGMDDAQFEKLIFENGSAHVNVTWDDARFFQEMFEKLGRQGNPPCAPEAEVVMQLQDECDQLRSQVASLQQQVDHLARLRMREKAKQRKIIRQVRILQAYLKAT